MKWGSSLSLWLLSGHCLRLAIIFWLVNWSAGNCVRAQDDSVLSRDGDERAITAADRQHALTVLLGAAERARTIGDNKNSARFLNRAGRLQLRLNLPDEAIKAHQQALSLAGSTDDGRIEVDNLNGVGRVYIHLSRCAEAQQTLERSISLSDKINYIDGKAEALLAVSVCQNYTNHATALTTAQQSLLLWQSTANQIGIAHANSAIGEFHLTQNQITEATRSYETALGIWRTLGLADEEADALINLGFIEYRKGDWQSVLTYLVQAQSLVSEDSEPYKMGQIASGIAEAFIESGLPERGLVKLKEALAFYERSKNPRSIMIIHWDTGKTLFYLGKYTDAIAQLNVALDEASAIHEPVLMGMCYEFIGRTFAATGDPDSALQYYDRAVALYISTSNQMEAARTTALRGWVLLSQGKTWQARESFVRAQATFEAISDQLNQSVVLYALGKLEMQANDLARSDLYLRRSIQITEDLRSVSQSADLTAAFSATVYERYETYIECLMLQKGAQPERDLAREAFETSEFARGRSLAELLRATETNLLSGLDPHLAEQEKTLRQLLRFKANQQTELLGREKYKKEDLDALAAEQAKLEADYKQVTDTIRLRYPSYGEITRPTRWTLPQIQEKVVADDQTVLLEFSLGDDKSYVWAVTRHGLESYELPGRLQINQAAQRVYKLLSQEPGPNTSSELNAASKDLSRMILTPLARQLNKPRIIVVADGALHYVPFQILLGPTDTNGPLVANHEVVNAPSASILGELRNEAARRRVPAKLLAAFGDPIFELNYAANRDRPGNDQVAQVQAPEMDRWRHALRDIELNGDTFDPSVIKPLFHAEEELTNISRLATGRDLLLASKFSASREQLLRTDLTQFAILHIATHGFLDPKRPENSGLVLSTVDREGKPQNGFVGLQDIYGLNAPVDLVVLSACQTGLGKDVRGEGLIGLTRGFMYAGASTVVASLWKVDDEVTAELMKQFYINLLQKEMTPAAALRAAQNTIRQRPEWSAPYYWAAFTLQGEYRQAIRPAPPSGLAARYGKFIMGGLLLAILLGAGYWFIRRRSNPNLAGASR